MHTLGPIEVIEKQLIWQGHRGGPCFVAAKDGLQDEYGGIPIEEEASASEDDPTRTWLEDARETRIVGLRLGCDWWTTLRRDNIHQYIY